MAPKSPAPQNWREARRLRALELKAKGWKQREIAEALGVSDGAVSQWMHRVREGGAETLRHVSPPGAACRLRDDQQEQLGALLKEGAQAHGFRGEVWTGPRVARFIKERFGIGYHPKYVPHLLKALGFSRQKPVKKAHQQDEAAVSRFRAETWPEIKKSRGRRSHDRPDG